MRPGQSREPYRPRKRDPMPGALWPLCTTCSQRPCSPYCKSAQAAREREASDLQHKAEDAYQAPTGHVIRTPQPSRQGAPSTKRSE